jgi:cobalt/nickel transport protein
VSRRNAFLLAGLVVSLLLAGVVSGFASGDPDGLERVAQDKGFAETAEDHALADGPLADYTVRGVEDERLSTGLAGVLGVGITFAFGLGLFALVKRRDRATPADAEVQVPAP